MINFDASSTGATASDTSLTVAHTCSGVNRLLVVALMTGTTDIDPTVTYNSVAMTRLDLGANVDAAIEVYYYYLVNPSTGNNNIVVTVGAAEAIRLAAASYTGVKQQAPEANDKSIASTSPVSKAVTVLTNQAWTIAVMSNGDSNFTVTSSGDTKRVEMTTSTPTAIVDSNTGLAPGSHTTSATFTGGRNASMIIAAFAPAGGVVSTSGYFEV